VPEPETTAPETVSASAGLLVSARDAIDAGDLDRAEALLQRAQRIDSQNGDVYLALARLYRERGNRAAASGAAERGLLYCQGRSCAALRELLRDSGA
jgi:predicted Zn-dependent protease